MMLAEPTGVLQVPVKLPLPAAIVPESVPVHERFTMPCVAVVATTPELLNVHVCCPPARVSAGLMVPLPEIVMTPVSALAGSAVIATAAVATAASAIRTLDEPLIGPPWS